MHLTCIYVHVNVYICIWKTCRSTCCCWRTTFQMHLLVPRDCSLKLRGTTNVQEQLLAQLHDTRLNTDNSRQKLQQMQLTIREGCSSLHKHDWFDSCISDSIYGYNWLYMWLQPILCIAAAVSIASKFDLCSIALFIAHSEVGEVQTSLFYRVAMGWQRWVPYMDRLLVQKKPYFFRALFAGKEISIQYAYSLLPPHPMSSLLNCQAYLVKAP